MKCDMHTKFEFKNFVVNRNLDDLNLSGRGICNKIVFWIHVARALWTR